MKKLLKPSAKSVIATDAAIQKKIFGSFKTTSKTSNDDTDDIMKIIKSLEESGLLIKSVSKTIKSESKEQKGGFLSMFMYTTG